MPAQSYRQQIAIKGDIDQMAVGDEWLYAVMETEEIIPQS